MEYLLHLVARTYMLHSIRSLSLILTTVLVTGCSATDLPAPGIPEAESAAPPGYAPLLKRYVTPQGVRYAAWHQNQEALAALDEVVKFYAETRPPSNAGAALAWYLNAYNAWILHEILEK